MVLLSHTTYGWLIDWYGGGLKPPTSFRLSSGWIFHYPCACRRFIIITIIHCPLNTVCYVPLVLDHSMALHCNQHEPDKIIITLFIHHHVPSIVGFSPLCLTPQNHYHHQVVTLSYSSPYRVVSFLGSHIHMRLATDNGITSIAMMVFHCISGGQHRQMWFEHVAGTLFWNRATMIYHYQLSCSWTIASSCGSCLRRNMHAAVFSCPTWLTNHH